LLLTAAPHPDRMAARQLRGDLSARHHPARQPGRSAGAGPGRAATLPAGVPGLVVRALPPGLRCSPGPARRRPPGPPRVLLSGRGPLAGRSLGARPETATRDSVARWGAWAPKHRGGFSAALLGGVDRVEARARLDDVERPVDQLHDVAAAVVAKPLDLGRVEG